MRVYYIGADVHSKFTEIAIEYNGNIIQREMVRTTVSDILEVLSSLNGKKFMAIEEGTMADWLYRNIKPHVDDFIVSDPRRNKLIASDGESLPLPHDEKQGHKSWHKEPLRFEMLEQAAQKARVVLADDPDFIAELEWLGRRRSLIYKVLMLTGLRKGELVSITVGQVWLDEKQPYLELKAKDEKAGRGAQIPLRTDIAAEVREYMCDKLNRLQQEAKKNGNTVPVRLPAGMGLFDMPRSMVGIFDRDIAAAGIAKRDERGRTLDVHALRHTFGTHLSKAGVTPRVAQAAMRHSSLHLTMNIYTDPTLLDVAGAINALPKFAAPAPNSAKTA